MLILGIETSCDETAAALVDDGTILSNVISSQIDLHASFGGVVPEVASRKHVEAIGYVIRRPSTRPTRRLRGLTASRSPPDTA